MGFGVDGSGMRLEGLGSLGLRLWGSGGSRGQGAQGLGFRVEGLGVQGLGFRVEGSSLGFEERSFWGLGVWGSGLSLLPNFLLWKMGGSLSQAPLEGPKKRP